jgi:signal transduction histidine kinase
MAPGPRGRLERTSREELPLVDAISREIRVPANRVQASIEIAMHEARRTGTAEMVADLDRMDRGCRRLLRLADDLLDLSRGQALPSGATERIDLPRFCAALFADLELDGGAVSAEVEVRQPVPSVRVETERLGRLLLRLLQSSAAVRRAPCTSRRA